jgi:hypothetical protein
MDDHAASFDDRFLIGKTPPLWMTMLQDQCRLLDDRFLIGKMPPPWMTVSS